MYWYKKNVVPQKHLYICMSTKTHVHIHVQEHLLTDVGFCLRVLISSVNHEFIRETADRLSVISLLKWCSNMYKNFLYKIICIWFTTQAFTIIISVCQWTKETGDPVPRAGLQTKISNSEIIPTFILKHSKSNFLLI